MLTVFSEIGIFALALICFVQAYSGGKGVLFLFLVFDAWLFEWVILSWLKYLSYNPDFTISLLGIPLMVVLGWTVLIYSFQNLFVNTKNIFLKAMATAVFMCGLDLIMDVVAVHYEMWQWNVPYGYFGIPYNNFFGWFLYSFLVSMAISLFLKNGGWKGYLKMLIFITIPGLVFGEVWYLIPQLFQAFIWWGLYIISLAYVLINVGNLKVNLKLEFLLPIIFFLLFCVFGIVFSFSYYQPLYLLISMVILIVFVSLFGVKKGILF